MARKHNEVEIYTKDELAAEGGNIAAELPPAGYKRDDELARRQDILEEKVEKLSENKIAVDPKKLEPDREIIHDIERGFLDIDIGPQFAVQWINFVTNHGAAVWAAKANGWKVVHRDMLKGNDWDFDLVKEDNTLRVGDVIAMYMPVERKKKLDQDRDRRKRRRELGLRAELEDLAYSNPKAFKLRDDLIDQSSYTVNDTPQRAMARKVVRQHLINKTRND